MLHSVKTAAATAMLLLAIGCKREALTEATANATPNRLETNKLAQWVKNHPLSLSAQGRTAGNSLPGHTLQWGQVKFAKATATHFVPAALAQNGPANPYIRAGLVAIENAAGQITQGHYMLALPNKKTMGEAAAKHYNLARLQRPDEGQAPTGYSGAVLYYNMAGQLTANRVYKDGKLLSNARATLAARQQTKAAARGETEDDPSPNTAIMNCENLDPQTCIDWYWQTFVDGELVDEEYIFTTCCNTLGGGNGTVDTDEGDGCNTMCQNQSTLANQIFGQGTPVVTVESSSAASAPDSTGKIRMNKIIKMNFYTLDFFWGYRAEFAAYYHGVVYKDKARDPDWKWESLVYAPPTGPEGFHVGGSIPPCNNVIASYSAMPVTFSADRRKANIGYNYNLQVYMHCGFGPLLVHHKVGVWPTWWWDANWD
jgi:hypothetical protein